MPYGSYTRVGIEIFDALDLIKAQVSKDFEAEALAFRDWPDVPAKGDKIYLNETKKWYEVTRRNWASLVDGNEEVITTGACVTLGVHEVSD